MSEKQFADYGTWQSPLSATLIFQGRQTASYPIPWQEGVLFLLTMPEEENALALMYCDLAGEVIRISPPGFYLRSRVHEYGGLPFACSGSEVFYCNFKNQEIYRQRFDPQTKFIGKPVVLTDSESNDIRYSELVVDEKRQRLICVREDHRQSRGDASAVINTLVAIPLTDQGQAVTTQGQTVLFEQGDFIASPVLSNDYELIGFITWSHPNMPWDNTEMRVARFSATGALEQSLEIDTGQASSKLQPSFDADNNLYFLSDWGDYWNLVKVETEDLQSNCVSETVYPVAADCCGPPWETGKRNYALMGKSDLAISVVRESQWQLQRVNLSDNSVQVLDTNLGLLEQLRSGNNGTLFYLAATFDDYASIYCIDLNDREPANKKKALYKAPLTPGLNAALLSRAYHFQFPSQGTAVAYGLLYPPTNPGFQSPAEQLPPLLVNIHGGPTGTARAALNPMHQFWTSRGFAVLDLNHRGSTGYGRRFRRLLYQQWGIADIQDVVAAVQYLIDSKQVAPEKIAIRGGSAGGYAVLASLAACDLFAAGASYYGVSDLEMLARDTHKFESRYLEQLIGPYPETRDRYLARSPINKLAEIKAAVLILQGADDKVVPPNQAELINKRLSAQNPATEYICFEGEGHGFRIPANQIRALEAELSFYQRNLLGLTES